MGSTQTLGPGRKGHWKGNFLDFCLSLRSSQLHPRDSALKPRLSLCEFPQPRPGLCTGHRRQSPFHIASLDLAPDIQTQMFYCCLIPPLEV